MVGYDGHRGSISYLAVDPAVAELSLVSADANGRGFLFSEYPKIIMYARDNKAVITFYNGLGY